ncbi:MAG: hypothetical protein NWQ32_00520 [Paracoccaceae bacterium]|nr:hypothetical protein [Paracoccaceae bacterium]
MSDLQFLGHDLIFVSTKPAAAHVVFFEYKVTLAFFFDEGVFQRSKVGGDGWK